MLTCKFSCPQCGLVDQEVRVEARPGVNMPLEHWFEHVCFPAMLAKHRVMSPLCRIRKLVDIKIPMGKAPDAFPGQDTDYVPKSGSPTMACTTMRLGNPDGPVPMPGPEAVMDVKANKVADREHCVAPGDFYIKAADAQGERRLVFRCPCGCGALCGITVRADGEARDHVWGWNRNEEAPSCGASIRIGKGQAEPEHWHGRLLCGRFVKDGQ